jgi:hypothetical protein
MTRRSSVRAIAVLGVGAAASLIPRLYGAVPMTTLQIQVLTPGGRPVDRASVIVTFVKGRAKMKLYKKEFTHWELKTNQQGIAKIPPIPQGTIKIQVIATNYQTFGDFFEVEEPEKTVTVQLKEPQQQYSAHGDNDPTRPKESK